MKVIEILTEALIPYFRNARTHSEEQVAQIAASIEQFGWTNPILIKPDKTIIAGHGRLLAAQKIGMESVPCIVVENLSDEQCRALIIADNKLALNAGWDMEIELRVIPSAIANPFMKKHHYSGSPYSSVFGNR